MRSIADLMQAVASHLVGAEVILRFQAPAYEGLDGCFHKSASGLRIIDIKPCLVDDVILYVLLHESAHSLLHYGEIASSNVHEKASGSLIDETGSVPVQEDQADILAKHWLQYSRDHVKVSEGMSDLEARLWPLLEYERGE